MWSTCSIDTGHSRTQAPQVTQSQTTLSVTAPGTSGCASKPSSPRSSGGPSSKTWSRRAMISSFGDSSLPVAQAGTDVLAAPALRAREGVERLLPGEVAHRAGPEAHLLLGAVEAQRLEPASRARAPEEDVHRRGGDVEVLRVGEVDEERQDQEHVRPHEAALEHLGHGPVAEQPRERVRDGRPARRPLVQPQRDPARVPEQQRRDDPRDHRQDQVGLAEVAALEARRAGELADRDRGHHAAQDEHREDVHEQREPALVPEPRQRGVAVHGADQRHQDRREEDEEAPEDRRVHQPRAEALEQLALPEHDHRLVAGAARDVVEALGRLAHPHEVRDQLRATGEQHPGHAERRRQRERSGQDSYCERAFLSSAVMAGTISVRSPITA